MMYSGRYVAENEGGDGIIKVLINKKYRNVIGIHMIGNHSSEIIYGGATYIETEMPIDDIKQLVFPILPYVRLYGKRFLILIR